MQDLRPIAGGGAGGIFGVSGGVVGNGLVAGGGAGAGAGAGAVDRRLRHHHPQQNLKCPRCDSHNTKFCYYNNYNLSQPRHFCKSCRRYWTKGGVLRNVPVGGGCRKSKRSSSSSKPSKVSHESEDSRRSPSAAAPSRSSSDSSSLTVNAADDPAAPQDPEAAGATRLDSYATVLLESINEGATPTTATTADIFPEAGSFTSLVAAAATNPELLGLNFGNAPQFQLLPAQQPKAAPPQPRMGTVDDEIKMPGIPGADRYMDHIAHMDALPPPQGRSDGSPPLEALYWQGCMDSAAGLFDAGPAAVAGDHGGYWNQSQWGEIDPSFFLP